MKETLYTNVHHFCVPLHFFASSKVPLYRLAASTLFNQANVSAECIIHQVIKRGAIQVLVSVLNLLACLQSKHTKPESAMKHLAVGFLPRFFSYILSITTKYNKKKRLQLVISQPRYTSMLALL
jgi:hypothetical protein